MGYIASIAGTESYYFCSLSNDFVHRTFTETQSILQQTQSFTNVIVPCFSETCLYRQSFSNPVKRPKLQFEYDESYQKTEYDAKTRYKPEK